MAKIRGDAPLMPLETPPSVEVGEIDTRAPFQSVRDAVSLFRKVSFTKKQPPGLSSSSSSQDVTTDELEKEKETQLLLAEQEMDRVKICLDVSVKAKAQALSDLDSAQRKAADLRAKLESTKQSRRSAILTTRTMNQRLDELQYENQETDKAREDYILVTSEIFMAKHELTELKQQFSLSVEERLAELQRADKAECEHVVNSQKIKDMEQEIVEMRKAAEKLKSEAARRNEEAEKINEERIASGETYSAMKQEAEKRLEDLRLDCDPELRQHIEELMEISAENNGLQEEIKLARELKAAKSAVQVLLDEEGSYKILVSSLTVELDGVQRENKDLKEKEIEKQEVVEEEDEWVEARRKAQETMQKAEETRKEAEETMKQVEELKREASTMRKSMGEALKQLEIVLRAVEKAKTAEKRAVEDMRVLTEKQGSLTNDEPDKKIRISMREFDELRGKQEESEIMVELKAKTVATQLEEIFESKVEGEKMLDEKMKEIEELEAEIDGALRNAEIAEEAHCIVDAELRKWKPEEL